MDHVARVDDAQADPAGEGRGDMGVGQLERRALDLGLVDLERRLILAHEGRLRVHLLLGDGVLAEQDLEAVEVHPGVFQEGVVPGELRLGLHFLHLERARVDLRQRCAGGDVAALLEEDLLQLAVDAAAHGDGVDRRDRAEGDDADIQVHAFGFFRRDRHRPRLVGAAATGGGLLGRADEAGVDHDQQDGGAQRPNEPGAAPDRRGGGRHRRLCGERGKGGELWHGSEGKDLGQPGQ